MACRVDTLSLRDSRSNNETHSLWYRRGQIFAEEGEESGGIRAEVINVEDLEF